MADDLPPGLLEALARGEKTWADSDGSFWGVQTVSGAQDPPHEAPIHYGADGGEAYLWQQGQAAQQEQQRAIDIAYIQGQGGNSFWGPGSGDAFVLADQQRPQHEAEWANFEAALDRPDSLSFGGGNPVMPSGQEQYSPVWSPIGMRVIDRQRAGHRPSPGDPDYSGSGYSSGKSLGFQTAFTLPGWSGGYQMVGYPGDIQGWIPWGGSGV